MRLNRHEIGKLMKKFFGCLPYEFLDKILFSCTGQYWLDVLAFDDFLHKKFGDYDVNGMSMSECIQKEYGDEALALIDMTLEGT